MTRIDDLVVIGAGPYGLSIAAHAAAAGLDVRVLGRPMASWRDHMPGGMFLKSEPWSSNLSAPDGRHTLADYCATLGTVSEHGTPLPIGTFSAYGMWFARQAAPEVEEVTVLEVTPQGDGFRIRTAEGPPLLTRTVALAVGVMPFVHHPEALRDLPPGHYSHSSGHRDLSRFERRCPKSSPRRPIAICSPASPTAPVVKCPTGFVPSTKAPLSASRRRSPGSGTSTISRTATPRRSSMSTT